MVSVEGTALVIGGSSGMGQGAARALVARGVAVTVTSRTDEGVARAVAALDDVTAVPGVEQRGRVVCGYGVGEVEVVDGVPVAL